MKKIVKQVLILFFLLTVLILPYFVFAATAPLEGLKDVQELSGYAEADEYTVSTIAGTIVASALSFLGIIFIVFMIYGGYLWMSDQGNEEQVEKAKKIIRNSVIGLIIIVSAYAIYSLFTLLLLDTLT